MSRPRRCRAGAIRRSPKSSATAAVAPPAASTSGGAERTQRAVPSDCPPRSTTRSALGNSSSPGSTTAPERADSPRSDTMPRITNRAVTLAALVLSALIAIPSVEAQARKAPPRPPTAPLPLPLDASTFRQLRYRYIGPVGNRLTSAAGVPGDPSTYYVGAASGGVWKTTDGGVSWEPLFDEQPVQSIGSLAVAPSDPNVLWAGTGEDCIRSHISIGNGIYKSTDAGRTWTHMGLDSTARIARVVVHPTNPDVVYAAAL